MSDTQCTPKPPKSGDKDDRAARLAEQLRANLRRRKAQAKGMNADGADD